MGLIFLPSRIRRPALTEYPRRSRGAAATRPRNIRAAKVRDMSNGPDSNVAEILKKRHSAHNETTS